MVFEWDYKARIQYNISGVSELGGGHWPLHLSVLNSIFHFLFPFSEDGASKDHFLFVHIPKALKMCCSQHRPAEFRDYTQPEAAFIVYGREGGK